MRHLSVHNPKNRSDYEPIGSRRWSAEEQRQLRITGWCCLMVVAYVLVWGCYSSHSISSSAVKPQQLLQNATFLQHHETVPTVFSVRDPQTKNYIYALDNPVYDELQRSVLHDSESSSIYTKHMKTSPAIHVTWEQERVMLEDGRPWRLYSRYKEVTSLRVHWTTTTEGQDTNISVQNDILKDDDILVLQCGNSEKDFTFWRLRRLHK
jgi:hypothetical protein